MTASDLSAPAGVPTTGDDFGAMSAAMAGMPDPALLARMANEFFRDFSPEAAKAAIPREAIAPVSGFGISPSLGALPAGVPTSGVLTTMPATDSFGLLAMGGVPTGIPALAPMTDASRFNQVSTLPKAPTAGQASVAQSSATQGGLGSVPGMNESASLGGLSETAGFSFLRESRSLFATPPAVPVHAVNSPGITKIPTETELVRLAQSLGGSSIPGMPDSPTALTNPQIANATIPGAFGGSKDVSFGFLNDIKTLTSLDVSPFLAPVGSELSLANPGNFSSGGFDVAAVRRDFPILNERVNGRPLIWLDNAATTQKPQAVIDRLKYFYEHENSNIHRAAHTLAARATDAYEAAREKTRRFLNAGSVNEIIFVRGATEAINLIAQSWGRKNVGRDDEIVITWLEHHANIVPWQMLCAEKGARLRVAPVDNQGQVILAEYEKLLGPKTKLVSLTHVSNALGTVTPVEEMVAAAHRHGAKVLVDGAQAVSHLRVDVQASDCDFYVFSGHKVFAPTGIGVVYGKKEVLEDMPPWQGGGNMISDVTFERTLYHGPPLRFEAGTGNIADAVGLGAAIDYLDRIGMANITRHEHELLEYGMAALKRIPGLHLIGTAADKTSVMSFVLDGFRTEEVGEALNREGIAVRSGHHCAQPILRRFGLESTVRPSLALYNTCEDVDALVNAIWNLKNGRGPGVV